MTFHSAASNSNAGARELVSLIADSLVAAAVERPHGVSWRQPELDSTGQNSGRDEFASPTIYRGIAGIALFLLEAGRSLREPYLLQCGYDAALSAARHALASHFECGLFGGWGGIIHVLLRAEQLTGKALPADVATEATSRLLASLDQRSADDVIGGGAGLLLAGENLSLLLGQHDVYRSLVSSLIARAIVFPVGIAWDTTPTGSSRPLCGMAHGVAGFSLALSMASDKLRDPRLLTLASEAIAYEAEARELYGDLLPDYRVMPAVVRTKAYEHLAPMTQARMRMRHSGAPSFMNLWCHGSAGTALAVHGLLRRTDNPPDWLLRHAITVDKSLVSAAQDNHDSLSLCHGISGLLAISAARLRQPTPFAHPAIVSSLLQQVVDEGGHAVRQMIANDRKPLTDKGLMLGVSGVGMSLLIAIDDVDLPGFTDPSHRSVVRAYSSNERYRDVESERLALRLSLADLLPAQEARQHGGAPVDSFEGLLDHIDRSASLLVADILRELSDGALDISILERVTLRLGAAEQHRAGEDCSARRISVQLGEDGIVFQRLTEQWNALVKANLFPMNAIAFFELFGIGREDVGGSRWEMARKLLSEALALGFLKAQFEDEAVTS